MAWNTTAVIFAMINTSSNMLSMTSEPPLTIEPSKRKILTREEFYKLWHSQLRSYLPIALLVIGSICNMLAIIVFLKSKLRFSSSGVYLTSLAFVDTCCLLMEVIYRHHLLSQTDMLCKLTWYLLLLFKMMNAFLVVAFCMDIAVYLRFPFRSHRCINFRVAVTSVLVLFLVACCISAYRIGQYRRFGSWCSHILKDQLYFQIDFAIAFGIGECLTGTIVVLLMVYISFALYQLRKRFRRISGNKPDKNKVDRELTRMTIVLAVTFTLLRIPASLVDMLSFTRRYVQGHNYHATEQNMLETATKVSSAISHIRYCLNFLIYVIFWGAFREKLFSILRCEQSKVRLRHQLSNKRLMESTNL